MYFINSFLQSVLSLADTLVPIATVIGVCLALWQHYLIQKEKMNESKRIQASKVYTIEVARRKTNQNINLSVVNKSDLPIYNVFVVLVFNKHTDTLKSLTLNNRLVKYISILDTGVKDIVMTGGGHSSGGGKDVPVIFFTDSNNHGWFRDKDGHLTPMDNYIDKVFRKNKFDPPYSES